MAADIAHDLVDLIGSIYDSILEPDHWHGALARLCDLLDARAASIHFLNPALGRIDLLIEHGTDPSWTQKLLTTYAGMSPIGAAVMIAEVGEPVTAFDFIDEAEYVGSRFYREWCEPQGYYDMMGALLAKSTDSIGAVSATRERSKQLFGAPERELMRKLSPHFRRATTIAGLLGYRSARSEGFEMVIEHLACAVVLIDASRQIVHANPSARRMLEEGRVLQSLAGRLSLRDTATNRSLQDTLDASASVPLTLPLKLDDGSKRTVAVLRPGSGADTYAVLLQEPGVDVPAVGRHLMSLFGLSPREIAVMMPLLEGRSPAEIATQLGVSLPTVRTHLASLYKKTGTEGQTDLVRVVLQAMPPVRGD
jgi:DNA-binding CsgD family transcriptional regulator